MLRRLAALLLAILACVACNRDPVVMLDSTPPDQLARTFWPLADFSLTERSGQVVTLGDLKGKVWVADFFYSTCPGPCPMLSSRLSELQKALGGDDRVRLVSISTDPEKDTPEVLRQYAAKFGATERWLFLTGPKAAIKSLAFDNFKLPFSEQPGTAEPIIHSTRLILIDSMGNIRGLYEGTEAGNSESLIRDIRRLVDLKP